ncbi:MAG: tetratricopeptide repeat protein [Leptolyngbyaceae cyanobacterium CRU_2_3]|nr:tetratricopeptide repeat protein [Leptolyngbyaceae cyanobacterium CRU_2_3]
MKLKDSAATILGMATFLSHFAYSVQAQPVPLRPATLISTTDGLPSSTVEDLLNRGLEQAKQGHLQAAILQYTQALQAQPNYAPAYLNRGIAYHDLGDYNQAIADFQDAVKAAPNDAEAYYNLGEARFHIADLPGSLQDLNQAIALNSNHAKAYNSRGVGSRHDWQFRASHRRLESGNPD